jgi:hypothetical protein
MSLPAERPDDAFGTAADPDGIDRVFDGRVHPDDVSARYRHVARTLRALKSPASREELSSEPVAVRRAVVLLERSPEVNPRPAWRPLVARARVGALVLVGTMLGTTGAAMANVLPDPLERPVAQVLSHVGITVSSTRDEPRTPTAGTDATPAAESSSASIAPPSSVPPPGVEWGAAVSGAASDGKSHAGQQSTGGADAHAAPRPDRSPPEHSNAGGRAAAAHEDRGGSEGPKGGGGDPAPASAAARTSH